jgi:hypothetical protein
MIKIENHDKDELGAKLKRVERELDDVNRSLGQSFRDVQAY